MASSQVSYCQAADVTARLFSGQSSSQIPPNPARDSVITDDIAWLSREFERETGRPLNGFAPYYDVRYYSGRGRQLLDVDEYADLLKLEYNTTIAGINPNWVDVSAELLNGRIAMKPIRFWPKRQVFRQAVWIVDPYQNGNIRLTGVFGAVQPDLSIAPPVGQAPAWNGLTDTQIYSLTPNAPPTVPPPAGWLSGWWVTPTDVRKAVAEWALYTWNAGRAGYGDQPGKPGGTGQLYLKDIPPNVRRVISAYKGFTSKLALIGVDGSDAKEELLGREGGMLGRWSNWHAYDPTGSHPENTW